MQYKISKSDYKNNVWSGGTTKELFIYPKESNLKDRNFILRISSASVNDEESTFSTFSGFDRILMILDGKIKISHRKNESEKEEFKELKPFMQDYFFGDDITKSIGKCIDFNIIFRKGVKSQLFTIINGVYYLSNDNLYLIYAIEDIDIIAKDLNKNIGGNIEKNSKDFESENIFHLEKGDSYVFSNEDKIIEVVANNNSINALMCEVNLK